MITYYITLACVVVLLEIAEKQDDISPVTEGKMAYRHVGNAGIFYFLAVCVMIFVAGFRYYVGADYGTYYIRYTMYINELSTSIRKLDEPGFGIIAWIATRFYQDGAAPIFMASFITITLPMLVIYRQTDKLLFAGFLFFVMCWDGSFNGVRQYLALSVLFCGYYSLKERKMISYFIYCFLAFLFHRSAIVMVFVFFLIHRKVSMMNIAIMIVAVAILLFSYDRLFSIASFVMEKNYSIDNAYTATQVNRIRVISSCVPAIIFLCVYYGKELNEAETFHLNLTILHAAIRIFTMNSALLYRIGLYTSPFLAIAIPELSKGIENDNNRKIIIAGIVMMQLGLWWYEIFKSGSLNHFQWIWQRPVFY